MAWDDPRAVLHAPFPLEQRFEEVADLRGNTDEGPEAERPPWRESETRDGHEHEARVEPGHRHADCQTAHRTGERGRHYRPLIGTAFLHTVIDDYSRATYVEICADEKAATAIGVLNRAVAWFAERGVTVERVLSDNGSAYRSHAWRDACADLGIIHKRTRPYRPQTNGKIERFHRTLADGWAFKKLYNSESARRAALPAWLHHYNHHRPHTAIGGSAPITRLTNLTDQYT